MSGERRSPVREAVLCGLLAAVFYVALAATGPGWGDTADLARRAVTEPLRPFGRSYALQSALIRLAAWVVEPAAAAALVSSLAAAAGVGIVFFTARGVLRLSRPASAAGAAALAFAHTIWSSAVDGEVYALLGALVAATVGAVLAARHADRAALWAGVLSALAVTHHRAAALLLPAAALWLVLQVPAPRRGGVAVRFAAGLALGALPLVVLSIVESARAESVPTGRMVRAVVLGSPRNAELLVASERPFFGSLAYVAKWVVFNLPGPALVAAALGLVRVQRDGGRRALAGLVVAAACGLLLPVRFDGVGDRYVFLVVLYPLVAVLAAYGVQTVAEWRRPVAWAACHLTIVAPIALYLAIGTSGLATDLLPHLSRSAAREFFVPVRRGVRNSAPWARDVLARVGDGATVYAEWGAAGALDYAREVDGLKRSVRVVRRRPQRAELEAAAQPGVWYARTPIWRDDHAFSGRTDCQAIAIAPSLYRLVARQ